ncbi:glycoside hydrolase family 99-like domain-containing protein [Pseudomonas syringae group sp. J309-1]|uniref:glycosyltransferase WbsX family protein n=1 Tax=Pseudomonas syringae group sp. J309-1 TaxID=3079588 RepID=UPI00290E3DC4|nr:glycoside hydrolase family 99-like domain-containing protein [Pseudomonas syringae group sp. J309-1]MDU8362130.1 glycoside hydrolase family 99-like domain-containing protein [Pseudomonas syringae group sp. J309-1]
MTETTPSFDALSTRHDLIDPADTQVTQDLSKLLAFYLPQYHRTAENSEWWGPGFTEWTNVAKGKPNFEGHYQPHIPRELGFYDLTHPDVMYEQAEMAKLYGVYGFCFYHYWFSGRRILEKPVENFLKSDIDIKFCLCWANENWTRTWSGDEKSVLLGQNYADEDDENFILSLLEYFKDSRYILVDGKPMLVVYRAKSMPDPSASFGKWRSLAVQHGFPGLHIAVVDFYDINSPEEVNADALVEFPPHKFNGPQSVPDVMPKFTTPGFSGGVVDYFKMIAQSAKREVPSYKLYRGIIPSWDNTARRQLTPTTVVNATPTLFGYWLRYLRAYTREQSANNSDNFIFINAWNEWGEGCHLEPDQEWGLAYLEETLRSSYNIGEPKNTTDEREALYASLTAEMLKNAKSVTSSAESEKITEALRNYKPVGNLAHKISARLAKWPFLYKTARSAYLLARRIRG